ncbi:copper amine oxidase N-terminal domain-containing protein [Paenibacillus eucommiae]|uniref:Copper amine oxidase-like N-terminal domain-containing protein n=1 Tax=Paenibacillus eucommiae TaxID=1355755 RepID=A0ABS4J2U6_9BACL|nr:copper amine oxidase N-terminal domain-containing protein [Paenibacillus eucommiae]MBP1994159.1 hypothetical protein [Paenibacillus eucommiae]
MKSQKKQIALFTALLVLLASFLAGPPAQAISTSTSTIVLYVDQKGAFIDDKQIQLEVPATIIKDKMFVPAKFLGDALGFEVNWNDASRNIEMKPPGYNIVLNSDKKKATINGIDTPFDSVAAIVKGKLLVKLTWVADYMGAEYTYDDKLRSVNIVYTANPESIYVEQDGNSNPVARFTTAKPTYRIGEPINYVDLSYDPDAEGVHYEWFGKQEAFFAAGKYPVSLQVTDFHGHKSQLFASYVTVVDVPYLTEAEYPFYTKPVGGSIRTTNWGLPWSRFDELPRLPKAVTPGTDRKLLLSNSPEEFTQAGVLYQDQVSGKARLYANHINGSNQKMTMAILVVNSSNEPITLRTTSKGTVTSSVYTNIIGNNAAIDLLLQDSYDEELIVPPNRTLVYAQLPNFYPGEAANLFYDIETDGALKFAFVAAPEISLDTLLDLPQLANTGDTRGTFPVTELDWKIDASSFSKASIVTIGDNKTDPYTKGNDATTMQITENKGNQGVIYKIHADKPRKMAIMVLARGGVFSGSFKINGKFVKAPASGVMTSFDGMQILARTTGKEEALEIEFTPPGGSVFPIDLVFYPLDDK